MVVVLQKLGHLLGENKYLKASERALTLFYPAIRGQAEAYASFLCGLHKRLSPLEIVIVAGRKRLTGPGAWPWPWLICRIALFCFYPMAGPSYCLV